VAEYNQHRIQKFSLDGEFISQIGVAGDDDGQLDRPYDVAIDQEGNLYVTDSDNYRVQIFAPVQ